MGRIRQCLEVEGEHRRAGPGRQWKEEKGRARVYWAVLLLPCWAVGKEIGQGKKEKGSGALGWAEAEGREGPGLRAKDGEGKGFFFFPFSFVFY